LTAQELELLNFLKDHKKVGKTKAAQNKFGISYQCVYNRTEQIIKKIIKEMGI